MGDAAGSFLPFATLDSVHFSVPTSLRYVLLLVLVL